MLLNLMKRTMKVNLGIIAPADFHKRIPFGGSEGFVENVASQLECQVIVFGVGVNGTTPWLSIDLNSHISFIPISDLRYPSALPMRLKALYCYSRWRNRILKSDIDILYVHSPECTLPFLWFNDGVPVIFHQHGSGNPLYKSKYKWARSKFLQALFDFLLKIIHRRADWTIAIDRLCFQQVKRNGASQKVSFLMNAVNQDRFKPDTYKRATKREALAVNEEEFVIFFAGRLEEIKRVDRVIDAAYYLDTIKFSFKVFIAGSGTLRSRLEASASAAGIRSKVKFFGQIPHNELSAYYNMADVLVLPSEMEGTPMVVLEALSCGTPVITSPIGKIPNLIQNGINGVLLNDKSPKEIAASISFIRSYPMDRQQVARSVDAIGSDHFVRELERIFQRVLKN